jgi:hypothetical protein
MRMEVFYSQISSLDLQNMFKQVSKLSVLQKNAIFCVKSQFLDWNSTFLKCTKNSSFSKSFQKMRLFQIKVDFLTISR